MKFLVVWFSMLVVAIAESGGESSESLNTNPPVVASAPLNSPEDLVLQNPPSVDQISADDIPAEQPLLPKFKLEPPEISLAKAERVSGLENERVSLLRERLTIAGVALPSVPLEVLSAAPRVFDTPEVAEARSALAQAIRLAETAASAKIKTVLPQAVN